MPSTAAPLPGLPHCVPHQIGPTTPPFPPPLFLAGAELVGSERLCQTPTLDCFQSLCHLRELNVAH